MRSDEVIKNVNLSYLKTSTIEDFQAFTDSVENIKNYKELLGFFPKAAMQVKSIAFYFIYNKA